ncbi:MAG TPA: class II glutamine amidotransferase, partial [Acetobacteraceae bacterium]|nr:class II glutamine amidotransferase [Acetobacteraceae bacterium]
RHFVFAHNGTVRGVRRHALGRFHPIGETDSEHAFCVLLSRLDERFAEYPGERMWKAVARIASQIGAGGTFNFLLGDGTHLYARCATKLHYIIRKAPFARATLSDEDVCVDFSQVTTPRDRVAVIATQPLTRDEVWTAGVPGEMWVFKNGGLRATLPSPLAEKRG